MATNEHGVVKPQKIVDTAVGMLEQELLIPSLFQKEGVDNFRGTENDTYNVKVEGVLPFHDYAWRSGSTGTSTEPYNGRQKLQFDLYNERTYPVSFQGIVYNGVAITDEQADFDLAKWGKLLTPQVKAIARGLQRRAINTLATQNYAVTIPIDEAAIRKAFIEARRVLNKLNVPTENRYMVVGSNVEAAILNDENLTLTAAVSEARAESALGEAIIGRLMGFTVIVDQTIGADDAYAFAGNGFIFLNAAPSVPSSATGATTSLDGISMRWMQDYDNDYRVDRSSVDTYCGFRSVEDVLVGWNPAAEKEVVSAHEHFVRGVKLGLGATADYPSAGTVTWANYDPASVSEENELALITGLENPAGAGA